MADSVIIVGAGGHGRVLLDALQETGATVLGFTDPDAALSGTQIDGVPVIGTDEKILGFDTDSVVLVNGVGSVGNPEAREDVFVRLSEAGYRFANVIHPGAIVSPRVDLRSGAQIMAGAVVQTGSVIGENTIINTGARIDHDCAVGRHCHIAPGATLSGDVTMGDNVHVGAGATVVQGIRLGANSLIAAGAVVVENVGDGRKVVGTPAREMK